MGTVKNAVMALFRPAKGIDGAASSLKWLWVPLMLLLVASVAVKAQVTTPLQMAEAERVNQAQMERELSSMPKEERVAFEEKEQAAGEIGGEVVVDSPGAGIIATSAMVFSVLGAVAAVILTATFFLIAAKTWASPVAFTTLLSAAALSLVPSALRNFIQTAYMSSSGTWLQHSGLGDLVAPAATEPPGAMYALLSQIDIWVVWGAAILFGALCSEAVGIGRKRAITGMVAFLAITTVLRAVPTLIAGFVMGTA